MEDAATAIPEATALTIDEILAELDLGYEKLPRQAILAARENREQIIPRLIEVLEGVAAQTRAGHPPVGSLHEYALLLLGEFGDKRALPAILDCISLPGELPLDIFGDSIHEDVPGIVAALARGDCELIAGLVRNRELNFYVRWGLSGVFLFWVRDGILARDQAVERLRKLLAEAIAGKDAEVAGPLVCSLCDYAPREALAEIREAYAQDLADPFLIDLKHVEEAVAKGDVYFQEHLGRCRPTGIPDVSAVVQTWCCFREKPPRRPDQPDRYTSYDELPNFADSPFADSPAESPPMPEPIRASPRVGRNDPCPCGSGKKFKKCCLRKSAESGGLTLDLD